jgi:hypothetical protein
LIASISNPGGDIRMNRLGHKNHGQNEPPDAKVRILEIAKCHGKWGINERERSMFLQQGDLILGLKEGG